jgi:metal-responsive CopG/Arc/MetJ family transcriptional regulator
MAKSKTVIRKRPGRPAKKGDDVLAVVSVRMTQGLVDQVEAWARHEKTDRSRAIRKLIEAGLKTKR